MRLHSILLSWCLSLALALPGAAFAQSLLPFGPLFGFPLGYTLIMPTPNVEVGHLYVVTKGKSGAFTDTLGSVYAEECPADFRTGSLHTITSGDNIKPTVDAAKATFGINGTTDPTGLLTALLKVITPKTLPTITGSLELDGVDHYALSDDDVAAVEGGLSTACKNKILKDEKQKLRVVIVWDAEKASKVILSSDTKSGGAGLTSAVENDDLYLGIIPRSVTMK